MSDYIYKCEICGKDFDLYNGEGWGESFFDEEAILPKTRYVCMECKRKGVRMIKNGRETELYDAGYNRGLKDAYERVLIKLDIIDDPHKIIRLYPQDEEDK